MLTSGSHLHGDGLSQFLAIEDAFHIVLWCRGPSLHSRANLFALTLDDHI